MDALPYFIIVLTLVCMGLLNANMALFNFTVICMEPEDTGNNVVNGTHRFTTFEEGWILSMVAIGAITGTVPAIHITNSMGLRATLTIFCIVSAVSTVLMPIAAMNFYFIMVARFIQLGPFMAMWSSGYFCTSPYGWQGVYYLYGCITLASALASIVSSLCLNSRLRFASKVKVEPQLEEDSQPAEQQAVPYASMAKSASIWGILASGIASCTVYDTFLLYGPIYLNTVLKHEIQQTGILSALPYLLTIVIKILSGIFLDRARCISEHRRNLYFVVIFQLAMAFSFIGLTLISADMAFVPEALFTLTMVVSGMQHVGLMNTSQVVAQQYTHILTSVLAAQNSLGGFVLPPIIAFFVPHYSESEWSRVFYGITTILLITTVIFMTFTKVKPASWTKSELKKEDPNSEQKISEPL
uniref:MFS domain-containing protein n=1 Tax=Steinernema glaseri TaxID=37863 RepID=A0A1I7YCB2_9BILA